jgi:hypothetical protein
MSNSPCHGRPVRCARLGSRGAGFIPLQVTHRSRRWQVQTRGPRHTRKRRERRARGRDPAAAAVGKFGSPQRRQRVWPGRRCRGQHFLGQLSSDDGTQQPQPHRPTLGACMLFPAIPRSRDCVARRTHPKASRINIPGSGSRTALRTGLRRASLANLFAENSVGSLCSHRPTDIVGNCR